MLCVFRVFDCDAIRCVACVAYDNLETACRPMKTDLKVGFQAAVRNATDATHTGHATQIKKLQRTQCMHTRNATDAIESVVSCVSCIFWFFDCKPCVRCVACCVRQPNSCRPMWHTAVYILWWVSGSAVRRNVMSNYVTLSLRQRPVCQFSWCPQRDMSLLWPVIKLYSNSTSDRQMITSDGGGRSPTSLRTFVIGLGPPENCGFCSVWFRLKTSGFRFQFKNRHSTS